MRIANCPILTMLSLSCLLMAGAVHLTATTIYSANGYPWDVDDYTGYVGDGGDDAFDNYGYLTLYVSSSDPAVYSTPASFLSGFNLSLDGSFYSMNTVIQDGVAVARTLYSPASENYLRYFDSFTNTTSSSVQLLVTWGGNLGSDDDTVLSTTSSGALQLTSAESWAVTVQNYTGDNTTAIGDPVVGYLVGNTSAYLGAYSFSGSELSYAWSGNGDDSVFFGYSLDLDPGETLSLLTYLYRGLPDVSESYGVAALTIEGAETMTQVELAAATLAALEANLDLDGLSPAQISTIANFNVTAVPEPSTALLLGAGLALVGLRRPRRR